MLKTSKTGLQCVSAVKCLVYPMPRLRPKPRLESLNEIHALEVLACIKGNEHV